MGETKKEILSRLKSIESKVDEILYKIESTQNQNETAKMGRIELAIDITGLAKPTIYSLVSNRKMPHYKMGKTLYFKRQELEDWISSGRRKTISELVDS